MLREASGSPNASYSSLGCVLLDPGTTGCQHPCQHLALFCRVSVYSCHFFTIVGSFSHHFCSLLCYALSLSYTISVLILKLLTESRRRCCSCWSDCANTGAEKVKCLWLTGFPAPGGGRSREDDEYMSTSHLSVSEVQSRACWSSDDGTNQQLLRSIHTVRTCPRSQLVSHHSATHSPWAT